jgi:small-conductance mechanosensitive channel
MRFDLLSTFAPAMLGRASRSTPGRSALAILTVALISTRAGAQTPASGNAPNDPIVAAMASAARAAQRTDEPATLVYANRRIVELRATILSRTPAARAAAASAALDGLVTAVPDGEVTTHAYDGGTLVSVGGRPVFAVLDADVDPLAGEQLDRKVADAASRLSVAFREAGELRSPRKLLRSVTLAVAATVVYLLLLWLLVRLDTRAAAAAGRVMERRLRNLPGGEVMVAARAPLLIQRLLAFVGVALALFLTYSWVTIVLRRFPYTRPWGERLKSTLYSAIASGGRSLIDHLPNLLTVLMIIVLTRFAVRLVTFAFRTVEDGRVSLPGVYPETAQPTRRIAVALLWIFALVLSYEFMPGAKSDAFKGVSVFIGLIISLGSTGIMNQVMSGLMVTYSRAVRVGDFVRIGDVEGTVTQLGTLSTKIKTPRNEEVTLPNALVVSQSATNFSRHSADGVLAPASVTIGYDVPWRQVQALLLTAAERTPGVRKTPAPVVLQTALGDFAVEYKVLVCVDQPQRRLVTLNALHANIQDAFNYYGVQIMSPAYEADPGERKIVPPSRWYSAPAREPAPAPASGSEVPLAARAAQRPAREA